MNKYVTIYDFANRWPNFNLIFFPFIFVIVGSFVIFNEQKKLKSLLNATKNSDDKLLKQVKARLYFFYAWTAFAVIFTFATVYFQISNFYQIKEIYEKRAFQVIEGKIEKFSPMPSGGHGNEKFDINGIHFEYSSVDNSSYGYSTTSNNGGAINEDKFARISYYNKFNRKLILKLEIKE